jgi:hypothetical protein
MVKDFAAALPVDDYHCGFSNETVAVHGSVASWSFLAEMCDMDRPIDDVGYPFWDQLAGLG